MECRDSHRLGFPASRQLMQHPPPAHVHLRPAGPCDSHTNKERHREQLLRGRMAAVLIALGLSGMAASADPMHKTR